MEYYQLNDTTVLAVYMDGFNNKPQQLLISDGFVVKGNLTSTEILSLEKALVGTHIISYINKAMVNAPNQIIDLTTLSVLAAAVDSDNLNA